MHKLRLLKILLLYLINRQPTDPFRPLVCRFWITPFDVELTRAVSHSYLAFAGLGRWCWNFHNVNWKLLLRERWTPLTHSELVFYRRAAKLFSTIEMTTTLIWWDDKMAYFEHRLMQGDQVSAVVYSRGALFAGRERIPLSQCTVGTLAAPPMPRPDIIGIWSAADSQFKQSV
jgi:hypothetical protein